MATCSRGSCFSPFSLCCVAHSDFWYAIQSTFSAVHFLTSQLTKGAYLSPWLFSLYPSVLLLLLLLLSRFSHVQPCATHRRQPTRLRRPWDSPGKNTGVGCHFLLQCMKVKSESEVAESCLTLSDPMDYSLPGSSIRGSFQARVLEWGAIAFSDDKPRQHIKKQRHHFANKGP